MPYHGLSRQVFSHGSFAVAPDRGTDKEHVERTDMRDVRVKVLG